MLHILLVILKIIGIVILALIGLLFFIALAVLFVPIRYRASLKREDTIAAKASVTWLLGIVLIRARYLTDGLLLRVRIFGYPIYDNRRVKKVKKNKKVKRHKKTVDLQDNSDDVHVNHETLVSNASYGNEESQKEEAVKRTPSKIKRFFEKIKRFFQKIKNIIYKIKSIITSVFTTIKKLITKSGLIRTFLKDETNKTGITSTFISLWNVLKYVGPTKIQGYVKFGTGDPCSTGQILGAACMFYGIYGNSFTIEPDFDNKGFETSVNFKGRIRIIRLLIIAVKLKRDESFNQLIKNVKRLKEEL